MQHRIDPIIRCNIRLWLFCLSSVGRYELYHANSKNSRHNLASRLLRFRPLRCISVSFYLLFLLFVVSDVYWLFYQRLRNGARTPLDYASTSLNCIEKYQFFPTFACQWVTRGTHHAHSFHMFKLFCKMLCTRSVEMFSILEISRTFNLWSSGTERRIFWSFLV